MRVVRKRHRKAEREVGRMREGQTDRGREKERGKVADGEGKRWG